MNSSNYRFTLDLHSTQSQISIPVSLGDTGRVWYISLSDGGVPYTIPDGVLAKMSIKRDKGSTLEAFCAIEKNTTIKYDFAEDEITVNTAAVAGIHDCTVTLYSADGKILAAPRFTMIVSDRVINRDDVELKDEAYTAVDAMLVKEAARQVAETERNDAEAERKTAEETRASSETSRAEAETLRADAEEGRVAAEEERKNTFDEIKEALENNEFRPRYGEVTLLASAWVGAEDPYSQVVSISGVTERSKVDLLPSVEQLAIFHDKDIGFVTENEDGVVTVYAIGDKPTQDYTIEICITEVKV